MVGITIPIPRLNLEIAARRLDLLVQQSRLAPLGRSKGRDHLFHKGKRGCRLLRHTVIHGVARPIILAEQRRFFGPQSRHFGKHHPRVIVGICAIRAPIRELEQTLSHIAVFKRWQRRLLGRVLQGNGKFALMPLGRSKLSRSVNIGIA